MSFTMYSKEEIQTLRESGTILAECLAMLMERVTEGMMTEQLDHLAETFIRDHKAVPSFKGYRHFPATLCTSINEECVHGIPGKRTLKNGDLLKIDCGVTFKGLVTDSAVTVGIGEISKVGHELIAAADSALAAAIAMLRPTVTVGDLSATIERTIRSYGFRPIEQLTGHGVGRSVHMYPDIPNLGKEGTGPVFPAWTVVAIEPIIAVSTGRVRSLEDGWTLSTSDASLCSHSEHTLLLTVDGCEVLTRRRGEARKERRGEVS